MKSRPSADDAVNRVASRSTNEDDDDNEGDKAAFTVAPEVMALGAAKGSSELSLVDNDDDDDDDDDDNENDNNNEHGCVSGGMRQGRRRSPFVPADELSVVNLSDLLDDDDPDDDGDASEDEEAEGNEPASVDPLNALELHACVSAPPLLPPLNAGAPVY